MREVNREEWTQYVHQGQAYGWGGSFSASSGNVNLLQLYNPAGSGVRLVIFQAQMAAGASTIRGTLLIDANKIAGATQNPVPMLAGSPSATKAVLQTLQQPFPAPANQIRQGFAIANTKDDMATPGSICELSEGQALDLCTANANIASFVSVWWAEVPTTKYA